MGIDFRPEYLQLAAVKQQLKAPTTLALTATATEQVARDIQQNLLGKTHQVFRYGMDRKNIGLIVDKSGEEKDTLLMHYLQQLSGRELFIVPLETRWKNFIKNYAASILWGIITVD